MTPRLALLAVALAAPLFVGTAARAQPVPPVPPGSIELAQRLTAEERVMRREQRRAQRQAVRPACQVEARAAGLRGPIYREARRAFVRNCVRSRVT
jgi:hypothetical protein